MSEPRFRVLDALGTELDDAIAREQRRRVPRARAFVLTLLATLLLAGATATASYLLTGSPIPGAHARDVPDEATPLRETARLMGLDAADPAGGRPWDVRVSRSRTGQLCTAVGQVVDGRLGIVGLDGRFRALPQLGYDTCGQAPLLVGARVFDAPRRADVRTVVSGVAGTGVTRVVVDGGGEQRTLELGPEGTFITVFAGYPEDVAPVIRLGERKIALAAVEGPRAADPAQGAWTVDARARVAGDRKGQTCAQVQRERSRDVVSGGMSYPVCGDLREDAFFFEVAALPRAEEVRKPRQTFAWGFATPRTVVWGATRADVARITIAGKPVQLSPKGFVAVFPEGTRPADLRVEVTLRGGDTRQFVGAQNLRAADGARLAAGVREPAVIPASLRPGPRSSWLAPERSTVRIAARVSDPAGGPDWAVRTFSARVRTRTLRCAQLGRIDGGRFVGPPFEQAMCGVPGGDPVRRVDTFVDDARAYAPKFQRAVAWGRTRRGAFLRLSAPEVAASGRVAARAPDPDGGAPYGLLEWRTADGQMCTYAGRVVGGTVGALDPRWNRFAPYPTHEGGSCAKTLPTRAQPLHFSRTSTPGEADPESARIRRTLPGRTIISGTAHPGVREITIETPRDVRTLRPAGPGRAFLIVYDGEFFSGSITVTARFTDGTTHRTTMPIG